MSSDEDYVLRFENLMSEIDAFVWQIDKKVCRSKTIYNTLERLKNYAKKQFCFFYAGLYIENDVQDDVNILILESLFQEYFDDSTKIPTKFLCKPNEELDSPHYTREFVLERLLDQIAFDLIILRHAYIDRQMGRSGQNALYFADLFAQDAIKLAIQSGLISENTTVLTYFHKTHAVQVIPYAPVAIIGIPVASINEKRQFILIAHEIAHYVYWHARASRGAKTNANLFCLEVKPLPNKPINDPRLSHILFSIGREIQLSISKASEETTSDVPKVKLDSEILQTLKSISPDIKAQKFLVIVFQQWLEEIFADIYGCLVAGPAINFELQRILADNFILAVNNGRHPIAAIRPFLYEYIFTYIHNKLYGFNGIKIDDTISKWRKFLEGKNIIIETLQLYLGSQDGSGDVEIEASKFLTIIAGFLQVIFEKIEKTQVNLISEATKNTSIKNEDKKNFRSWTKVKEGISFPFLIQVLNQLLERFFPFNAIEKKPKDDSSTSDNPSQTSANTENDKSQDFLVEFLNHKIFTNPQTHEIINELEASWESPVFYFDCLFNSWTHCTLKNLEIPFEPKKNEDLQVLEFGWHDLISRSGWGTGGPECDGSSPP